MGVLSDLGLPAFTAGGMPGTAVEDWKLRVDGLVEEPAAHTLSDIAAWPQGEANARLTSVSGFSVRALWQGVLWPDFLDVAKPLPQATHARFVSHGGNYETTVPLGDLARPRTILCTAVAGEPLERIYGGPLRMVVPCLWGYKSAKWLVRVEFVDRMLPGYWETRGYSVDGVIEPGRTMDINTRRRMPIKGGGEVTEF